MNIREVITKLEEIAAKHGDQLSVELGLGAVGSVKVMGCTTFGGGSKRGGVESLIVQLEEDDE